MNVLAFDTSSSLGSVAVGHIERRARGDDPPLRILARGFLAEQSRHSSGLVPLIRDVVDEAGIALADLSGVAVGSGPGSFTGVRVAAATAKGYVRALRLSLHPVSSLAAAAASFGVPIPGAGSVPLADRAAEPEPAPPRDDFDHPRYILFDAREERIYAACYRWAGGRFETVVTPRATSLGELLLRGEIPDGAHFAGDGAARHADAIREAGFPVLPFPAGVPTADGILRLIALDPEGTSNAEPGRWEPEYLRDWSGSSTAPARE